MIIATLFDDHGDCVNSVVPDPDTHIWVSGFFSMMKHIFWVFSVVALMLTRELFSLVSVSFRDCCTSGFYH